MQPKRSANQIGLLYKLPIGSRAPESVATPSASVRTNTDPRRGVGGLLEAYTEVAKRLGIMSEGERPPGNGPVLVKG